jgi:hypothetical protein
MVSTVLAVGALWAVVTAAVWATMVTDAEWQTSDDSRTQAAGESALLAGVAVLLPAAFVGGLGALAPTTTLRGRTLYAWADEAVAGCFVLLGPSLAYVARTRGLVDADGATTSRSSQERVWTIVGVGLSLAAVVVVFG